MNTYEELQEQLEQARRGRASVEVTLVAVIDQRDKAYTSRDAAEEAQAQLQRRVAALQQDALKAVVTQRDNLLTVHRERTAAIAERDAAIRGRDMARADLKLALERRDIESSEREKAQIERDQARSALSWFERHLGGRFGEFMKFLGEDAADEPRAPDGCHHDRADRGEHTPARSAAEPRRAHVGSMVVELTSGGNLRIGAAHAGGIIRYSHSGNGTLTHEVIVERGDRFDLLSALLSVLGADPT